MVVTGYLLKIIEQTSKQDIMMLHTQSILSGSYSCDSVSSKSTSNENKKNKREAIAKTHPDNKLVLNVESGTHFISLNKIIRIESSNNYCFVHLITGQSIFISRSLKEFENSLGDHKFYRIHNSHLINLNYLEKVIRDGAPYAIMSDKNKLPISRRKFQDFMMYVKQSSSFIC